MTLCDDATNATLRARALALAAEPIDPKAAIDRDEVVEFQLAFETYAIESKWVKEVYPLKDLTPLPGAPAFVVGIINVRGQILVVIDLRTFFDLPFKGLTNLNKVIILSDGRTEFGILADVINGVRMVPLGELQTSLPTLNGIRARYLRGVSEDRVVVLDGAKLLSAEEIIVDEQVEQGS